MSSRIRQQFTRCTAVFAAVTLTMSLGACGSSTSNTADEDVSASSATSGQPEGPTLAIGVAADQPGMGEWRNGGYSGFDVDVARYVANALGYADKQIVFKQVTPNTRVAMLDDAKVDLVVAGFAVTDTNRAQVAMTGPYLIAGQDLLIRADDARTIHGPADMAGRTACVVDDNVASALLASSPNARIEHRDDYEQCVTSLMVGSSDAIAGGDAILTGLARAKGADYLRVVGNPFGQEQYGIAVRLGSDELADNIAEIVQTMIADGTWQQAIERLETRTGYTPNAALNPPDPTEGIADTANDTDDTGGENTTE